MCRLAVCGEEKEGEITNVDAEERAGPNGRRDECTTGRVTWLVEHSHIVLWSGSVFL